MSLATPTSAPTADVGVALRLAEAHELLSAALARCTPPKALCRRTLERAVRAGRLPSTGAPGALCVSAQGLRAYARDVHGLDAFQELDDLEASGGPWVTTGEVARATGQSIDAVRAAVAAGLVPGARRTLGGRVLLPFVGAVTIDEARRRASPRPVEQDQRAIAANLALARGVAPANDDGDDEPSEFLRSAAVAEALGDFDALAQALPLLTGAGARLPERLGPRELPGVRLPPRDRSAPMPKPRAPAAAQGVAGPQAWAESERAVEALRALERLDPRTAAALWCAFVETGSAVRARWDRTPGGFAAKVAELPAVETLVDASLSPRRRGVQLLAGALVAYLYARVSPHTPTRRLDLAELQRHGDAARVLFSAGCPQRRPVNRDRDRDRPRPEQGDFHG